MIDARRLFFNQPKLDDKCKLINLWLDEAVQIYLGGRVSEEVAQERLCKIFNHWEVYSFGLYSVFEKSSKNLIGLCGLQLSDDGIELSYKYYPEMWGKGFAYESAVSVLSYGFNILKLEEVIAITQSQNTSSIRLLTKLGMKHVKDFERFDAIQSSFFLNKGQFKNV
jgi:ribosomal-protein-alanine N-acetyltransferase